MASDSVTLRPASATVDEGLLSARYLNVAADGAFRGVAASTLINPPTSSQINTPSRMCAGWLMLGVVLVEEMWVVR